MIQEVGALPSGTSAPNTVITEHAVHQLGLHADHVRLVDPDPAIRLTAAQITSARLAAAAAGMTVETKSSAPTRRRSSTGPPSSGSSWRWASWP